MHYFLFFFLKALGLVALHLHTFDVVMFFLEFLLTVSLGQELGGKLFPKAVKVFLVTFN